MNGDPKRLDRAPIKATDGHGNIWVKKNTRFNCKSKNNDKIAP